VLIRTSKSVEAIRRVYGSKVPEDIKKSQEFFNNEAVRTEGRKKRKKRE
jgi:hypothetical protein